MGCCLGVLALAASARAAAWQQLLETTVYSVALSAEGELVVTGQRDNSVVAYDASGDVRWSFPTEGTVYGVAAAGEVVAAASEDRHIYLLGADGSERWRYQGSQTFVGVALSADGDLVAAGSDDNNVYVLSGDGELLFRYAASDVPTNLVITGSAGEYAIFVGGENAPVVRLNMQQEVVWEAELPYAVGGLGATADGSRVLVGDEAGTVYLLDGVNGDTLWEATLDGEVRSVAISGDGGALAAGTEEGSVSLLNPDGSVADVQASDARIYDLALSGNGSTLVVAAAGTLSALTRSAAGFAATPGGSPVPWTVVAVVVAAAFITLVFVFSARRSRGSLAQTGQRGLLHEIWRSRVIYLFLLPTLLLLIVFNYYPAFSGIYHAFTEWTPGRDARFIGLENFRDMWQNRYFWVGVGNLLLLIVSAVLKLALPLLVAELLFHVRNEVVRYVMRTAFVVQVIVPGVVGILLWVNIYDPNIGLANRLLTAVGLGGLNRVWLGSEDTALGAIIFMGFPWVGALALLIFYGGLIAIPGDIFDAAKVDGVTTLRRIWSIDLPLLLGQLRLLLILTFIGTVQEFTAVLLTTGGGPGSATYLPALEMYYQAVRFDNFGLASAIGAVLFLVILGGTFLNLRYVKSSVEYTA